MYGHMFSLGGPDGICIDWFTPILIYDNDGKLI